jgi:hypothetical protein
LRSARHDLDRLEGEGSRSGASGGRLVAEVDAFSRTEMRVVVQPPVDALDVTASSPFSSIFVADLRDAAAALRVGC